MFLFLFFKLNIETRECFCWTKSWSSHVCDSWRSWNGFLVFLRHRSWIPDKNMLVFTATACFFSSILIFFHNRFVPWKGFQREFPRHPCDQQTAPSASRETRVTSNYCIKRKATREKVWARPSQRDLSVRDQESCCNCLWARPHAKVYMTSFYSLH